MGTSEVISLDDELPGVSHAVQRLRSEIQLAARTDLPVLFLGETGIGKDVVARLVHRLSKRRNYPFVAVNLAAIPDGLATSELAGHAKGAFTGAADHCTRQNIVIHFNINDL
jgi:anaerobic nitric oxide reductase transcription regulator